MPPALYYLHDPKAPAPNRPARFGSAVVIMCQGQILLEKRKDSCHWGIVSGDIHDEETFADCAVRRTFVETGIQLDRNRLFPFRLFDDPSRIVCFPDGNIYRIVHVSYSIELNQIPEMKVGKTSYELRFVDPMDLDEFDLSPVNADILKAFFLDHHILHTIR